MNLKNLSDSELLLQNQVKAQEERKITTELLWHLRELERRRLFADEGYSKPQKQELLMSLKNSSQRECERKLAELSPDAAPKEKARPLDSGMTEIRLVIPQELMEKLEKIRELRGQELSYAGMLEKFASDWPKKNDPLFQHAASPTPAPESEGRHIPAQTRRAAKDARQNPGSSWITSSPTPWADRITSPT